MALSCLDFVCLCHVFPMKAKVAKIIFQILIFVEI